jgi:GxxExxY protein
MNADKASKLYPRSSAFICGPIVFAVFCRLQITMNLNDLTEKVIGAVFEVSNTLGPGFLEKVYQRALLRELSLNGIRARSEASLPVSYKGYPVGEYFADLLVEDELVVELKCADRLSGEHTAQCLNYLRASGRTLCLLINFQKPRVELKRIANGFAAPD